MELWLIITIVSLNCFSWLVFLIVYKNIEHVTGSHVQILGKENIRLVKTPGLFMARAFYFVVLMSFTIASFFLFYFYSI